MAVRGWDFDRFDLIISSSHAVAKGVRTGGRPHLCYCHTPMRYVWDRFDDYFPSGLKRLTLRPVAAWLRRWDVRSSRGVTQFVANSSFVRDRIREFYGRQATVIHPYVDPAFLSPPLVERREDFDLVVSALVPYKRIDLAVSAARQSGRRLIVIGDGPLRQPLSDAAGPNVQFAGAVSREVIIDHLSRARSLILPGIEDFGITPLEAMALGTPVIAQGAGGVLDTVVPGRSGIFFETAAVHSLLGALEEMEWATWDRAAIRAHAATFSRERFLGAMEQAVRQVLG